MRQVEDRIASFETKFTEKIQGVEKRVDELNSHVFYKIDDHEDMIQLLNQAYVTSHNESR